MDQDSQTRISSRQVGLVLSESSPVILGNGVAIEDAVDPVLDAMGPEVCRERLMVDVNTLPMGKSDDVGVAVEEGATTVRIGPAVFGQLAEQPSA